MVYDLLLKKIRDNSLEVEGDISTGEAEELYRKLSEIRERVDSKICSSTISDVNSLKSPGIRDSLSYPLGFCDPIRNNVYDIAEEEGVFELFSNRGIAVKKIFGIYENSYFHNVIQVGNYIFDVAHDSVEGNTEKVFYFIIGKVSFKNIQTYEEMFNIMQLYWKVKVYPNTLFPEISLFFPYFIVYNDGVIQFKTTHFGIPLFNDITNNFSFAFNFLLQKFVVPNNVIIKVKSVVDKRRILFPLNKKESESLEDYLSDLLSKREKNGKKIFDSDLFQKSFSVVQDINRKFNE